MLEAGGRKPGTGSTGLVMHSQGSQPVKNNGFLVTVDSPVT